MSMLSFLRHLDPAKEIREQELKESQRKWSYNYSYLEGIAFADAVPIEDDPSPEWLVLLVEVISKLAVNEAVVAKRLLDIHVEDEPIQDQVEVMKKQLGAQEVQGLQLFGPARYLANEYKMTGLKPAQSPQQYKQFFDLFARPASCLPDQLFARMTLAGPLPNKLKRIHCLPDDFPVTNSHYQSAMGSGDTLEEALDEGRLFLWDFRLFEGFTCGTYPFNQQKYIGSPLALFAIAKVNLGVRQLTPIAIQCLSSKETASVIFTPINGIAWEMAKTTVLSAAANYHELIAHFSHTHLVLEAFAVSARRQLHPRHPIMHLLDPHITGTLNINKLSHEQLLKPEGGIDTVMAGEIGASCDMVRKAIKDYDFDAAMFPNSMAAMGVDDTVILSDYPYRDDATLLWNSILTWVGSYVAIYYETDNDVVHDPELQAWWAEVSDPENGGRISGMGEMSSVDYLTKAITHLIFTASCQHASVNFPQGDVMSLVTNMPTALYAQIPTRLDGYSEDDMLSLLPPLHAVQSQLNLAILLGTLYFTKLGDYGLHFSDPRVQPLVTSFQKSLEEIEQKITRRNMVRIPYVHLLPSKIPQSINI
jgi:arachidonate 15-lipoxygenase